MTKKGESPKREAEWGAGVGSMFKGLADLVEKLGDLAEKGEQLKRSGQFETKEGLRGIYGFNVRMGGLKGEEVRVEPFGNLRRDAKSGETVVLFFVFFVFCRSPCGHICLFQLPGLYIIFDGHS